MTHNRTVDREVHRAGIDQSCARFSTLPTIDGFEVIDADGRAVTRRETRRSASGTAFRLNGAAQNGATALSHAIAGLR